MIEQNNLAINFNEKELFIKYLTDYELPKKNIKVAEKINLEGVFNLFDKNFDELWEKINSSKNNANLPKNKNEFKEKILHLLRQSIFNILYIGIKDLKLKDFDDDELNNGIIRDFEKIMKNLFSVFVLEYELLNPSKKIKKVTEENSEKKKEDDDKNDVSLKKEKPPRKVVEINFNPEYIHIYEKILKEFDVVSKQDVNASLRKIALNNAASELSIKDKNELQAFYKGFIKYKRKQKT